MQRKIIDKIRKNFIIYLSKKGLLGKSFFPDHTERLRRSSMLKTKKVLSMNFRGGILI